LQNRHKHYHEIESSDPIEAGRLLGKLFGDKIRAYIAEWRDVQNSTLWRQRAQLLLRQTRYYFPEYVGELQAYADAADIDLLDLWVIAIEDELSGHASEKCTSVVANRGRLVGHSEDWAPNASSEICILKKRVANVTTLELYYYASPLGGVALSISSQGYIQCINSIAHVDSGDGVPKSVTARALSELQIGANGLQGLLAIPRSSGFAHTLVDREANLITIECTATQHRVAKPKIPFVHTNHIIDPLLGQLDAGPDSDSSLRRLEDATAAATQIVDLPAMIRLVEDQSRGKSKSINNKNTIARTIVDLDKRTAYFWLKRESKKGWAPYSIDFLFGE
jgi:hypothetical protein